MKVMVIDYGMGNLRSVKRAFEECDAEVMISDNPKDMDLADHIVLPGVGAFGDGMSYLREKGWIPEIKRTVADNIPLLGICLGMQLLADKGYEGGEFEGLGLIPGEVKKFVPPAPEVRIPHVGWNEVYKSDDNLLFRNISNGSDFYFVHSYHFIPASQEYIIGKTLYCGEFVSAAANKNVYGVQFHPEKSSRFGFQLIRNFLKL